MAVIFLLVALACGSVSAVENHQTWSEQAYEDASHTFLCNDTFTTTFINPTDTLQWTKHGHAGLLTNNAHYELREMGGIQNMALIIKKVTDETEGIYFCEVFNTSDALIYRVVKGMNVGGHKYRDLGDKYRSGAITGIVSAAAVFVLITGICAINTFRYMSPEQKQKLADQKAERRRVKASHKNGTDNVGMDMSDENGTSGNGSGVGSGKNKSQTHGHPDVYYSNTHL